jgi:hypothetical protein
MWQMLFFNRGSIEFSWLLVEIILALALGLTLFFQSFEIS